MKPIAPWCQTYPAPLPLNTGGVARCIAVAGNFDGVHAGHLYLLKVAATHAAQHGLPLVALTFWPHPRTVLSPTQPLPLLQTLEDRVAALGAAGVAGVAVVPFNAARAAQAPTDFVREVLQGWLQAKMLVVGENFKFGHKAQGTPALVNALGTPCTAVPLLDDGFGVVSSSRLRQSRPE